MNNDSAELLLSFCVFLGFAALCRLIGLRGTDEKKSISPSIKWIERSSGAQLCFDVKDIHTNRPILWVHAGRP